MLPAAPTETDLKTGKVLETTTVRDFVFRSVDEEMTTALAFEVKRALQRWEPRVDIVKVTATPDVDSHELVFIDIQYAVKGTNDRRNLVFPYYTIPEDGSDY